MPKGGPIRGWKKITPLLYENRYAKGLRLRISHKLPKEISGHIYQGWGILLIWPNGKKTYLNPSLEVLTALGVRGGIRSWTEMTKKDALERAFAYMRAHKAGW